MSYPVLNFIKIKFIIVFHFVALSFDVQDRVPVTSDLIVHDEGYDPDISMRKKPSRVWELDVRPLISTKKWLMNYGLKRNRLDLYHILPQIGFKHAEGRFVYLFTDKLTMGEVKSNY
jgi:hypothetical protein